jgi:hypothetical protein
MTAMMTQDTFQPTSPARLFPGLRLRLIGPGGLYNLGNAFGLATGLGFYLAATPDDTDALLAYFTGSFASTLMTLSMLVFFWSGEVYHRAFSPAAGPDFRLLRRGDVLSGLGALLLGGGLMALGHPVLAATAGLAHAIGKFGSGWSLPGGWWPAGLPDFWRSLVLASRIPAIAAALSALWLAHANGALLSAAGLTPVTLLVCYGLWLAADLSLLRSASDDAVSASA